MRPGVSFKRCLQSRSGHSRSLGRFVDCPSGPPAAAPSAAAAAAAVFGSHRWNDGTVSDRGRREVKAAEDGRSGAGGRRAGGVRYIQVGFFQSKCEFERRDPTCRSHLYCQQGPVP